MQTDLRKRFNHNSIYKYYEYVFMIRYILNVEHIDRM